MPSIVKENAPVYPTAGRIHRTEESKENAKFIALFYTPIIASRFQIFWDAAPRALLSTRLAKYRALRS
jgi:hypothetical protein